MSLAVNHLVGFGAGSAVPTMYQLLQQLQLTTNLNLCVDAGDISSYDGSSQTWTDRAAGNNLFRGTTSGSEAENPTFVGTAGTPTAYFSFDGGDYFISSTSPTYANGWSKTTAHSPLQLFTFRSLQRVVRPRFSRTATLAPARRELCLRSIRITLRPFSTPLRQRPGKP